MFLALGVGAWSAAVFHFMIHAFFKALLFLGAGALIMVLHHEHNMFKMGGLWKKLPVVFWTYLIASASLAALPLVTAGFYSKDQILWLAYDQGNIILWAAGAIGALITAIYTFRMVFVTFFGKMKTEPTGRPGKLIAIPLIMLAFLSFGGGFIEMPATMGHVTIFSDFVNQVFPHAPHHEVSLSTELLFQAIAAILAIGGIWIAYVRHYKKPVAETPVLATWEHFLYTGWGFDWLYDRVIVRPVVWFSRINKNDITDKIYDGIALTARFFHVVFSLSQSGRLRWYVVSVAVGAIIALTIILYG
jgi:NADH-quinone oxidoreductase subunit L